MADAYLSVRWWREVSWYSEYFVLPFGSFPGEICASVLGKTIDNRAVLPGPWSIPSFAVVNYYVLFVELAAPMVLSNKGQFRRLYCASDLARFDLVCDFIALLK